MKKCFKLCVLFACIFFVILPLQAEKVDVDKAERVAQRYVQSKDKSHSKQDVRLKYAATKRHEHKTIPVRMQQPATPALQDTVGYYVFNVNESSGGGFVIISGDDRAKPVLGYSDNGYFDENELPPNFAYWLDFLHQQITYAQKNNLTQNELTHDEWEYYLDENNYELGDVAPLIETTWNQSSPFNNLCPKQGSSTCVTGCVATAMAQIMKYHNYPAKGSGQSDAYTTTGTGISIPSVSFAINYDWNNMLNKYSGVTTTEQQQTAVATLMYHCGVSVKMNYSTTGSSALSSSVITALTTYFGYDKSMTSRSRSFFNDATWEEMLRTQIDAQLPVFYAGSSSSGGHAFICDGYNSAGAFHFNWGWGGLYDGYFVTNALNPGTGGAGSGSGTYNEGQSIIVNIKPDKGGVATYEFALLGFSTDKNSLATVPGNVSVTAHFKNVGAATFPSGSVGVVLVNDAGAVSVIGTRSVSSTLPSGYNWTDPFTIPCTVPNTTALGQYKLRAVVKATGESNWKIIDMAAGCPNSFDFLIGSQTSVAGVSLNKTTTTITAGNTEQLTATVSPSNAADKSVTWSSSSNAIATVSNNGLVTAVSQGTANITVKTNDGGKTATCAVTVEPKVINVTSVTLNKSTVLLVIGETETLSASVLPVEANNKTVTWSSSNTGFATVDGNGKVTAISAGTATITVKTNDGGKTATCAVTVLPKAVTGVTLNITEHSLEVGSNVQLTSTVAPSDATNKTVTWSSDKPTVATVDGNGKVTAISVGAATITVKTNDGGKTATCSLTVLPKPVTGVTLNKTELSLVAGSSEQLTPTVLPSDATDKTVTWSSDNTAVAEVDNTGTVTAVTEGTATVTVKTNDGDKTATCIVTVAANIINVTGINLNKSQIALFVGDSEQLTAAVEPEDATNNNITWSSNDDNVATVDQTGMITAINPGTATVTATSEDGEFEANCIVAITQPATGVDINKRTLALIVGNTETLTATVKPDNASNKNITWSSDDNTIATVDQTGKVTALVEGTATITVTTQDGEFTANCTVTVAIEVIDVTEITLDRTEITLLVGNSTSLTPTVLPSDATNKSVTWSSNDNNVAIVDQTGKVTAVARGTANITATTDNGGLTAVCNITVTQPVTGVTLNKSSLALDNGSTEILTATVEPNNANNKTISWHSDNTDVATVDNAGLVKAVSCGTATISVTTEDGEFDAYCIVTVTQPVTGVTLNESILNLFTGKTGQLIATVEPDDARNKTVTWSSDKPAVATVDQTGTVTAAGEGTAIITVTTQEGDFTASCTVTVAIEIIDVTGVTVNKSELELFVGETEQLTATVLPPDATDKTVTWNSDNTAVASVNDGVVKALSIGVASITVTTADGGKTATCIVNVLPKPVTAILLNETDISIVTGSAEQLIATVLPSDATDKTVKWSSSNTDVATVDDEGIVTAVSVGSATITVSTLDDIITATCSITVLPINVTDIRLNKSGLTLKIGDYEQLFATVLPADATNKTVTWSSNNNDIATVSDNGTVTAISEGLATITVKTQDSDKTATCIVLVSADEHPTGSGVIGGTVTGAPAGTTIYLYVLIETDLKSNETDGYTLFVATVTDAAGRYTFNELPAGTYRVFVEIPGYESQSYNDIYIGENGFLISINFSVNNDNHTIVPRSGITDVKTEEKPLMIVYPNPADGMFFIQFSIQGVYNVTLHDIAGKIIIHKIFDEPTVCIDISNLPSGMYILKIYDGKQYFTTRIVKN